MIRKICPHCKKEDQTSWQQFKHNDPPKEILTATHFQSEGCRHCYQTGFLGREALIESVLIDDDFTQLIAKNADIYQLWELAKSKSIPDLLDTGFQKVIEGKTTPAEVLSEAMVF